VYQYTEIQNTEQILSIRSESLTLIAASEQMLRSELTANEELAKKLHVKVSPEWPPPLMADGVRTFWLEKICAQPQELGWWAWYVIHDHELVGGAGFFGPPSVDGTIEVGYSVLSEFQCRGICTRAVKLLLDWAARNPDVSRILAHAFPESQASIRVLMKCGFQPTGTLNEEGASGFQLLLER
jgi:ribosomal-protein-alanine N-acetyltransferase